MEISWRKREARFDMVAPNMDAVEDRVFRRFGKKGIVCLFTEELGKAW